MRPILRLKNVSRRFGEDEALKGFDFEFPSRGLYGIIGPSGCGKSTLLNAISGLDLGYEGKVYVLDKEWKTLQEEERTAMRLRHFGYVFQSLNLLELESVEQNILFPIETSFEVGRDLKNAKVNELLSLIGMKGYGRRIVNTLSGGEKQRVAFARALACSPEVLLADEPSGALDSKNAERIFSLMSSLSKNRLVIVVTHDEELASRFCDHLLYLKDGHLDRVVEKETQEEKRLGLLRFWKGKAKPSVPIFSWVRHSFARMKAKKWRSLIAEVSISLGLLGVGLSAYVSSSIAKEIDGVFSSFVPSGCVVMSPRNDGLAAISNVYAAPIELMEEAVEEHPDLIKDWGSTFVMEFEEWFRDENSLYAVSGPTSISLPGFSVRSINDFLWLDEETTETVYPSRPLKLDEEEVVLGLPYATMFNLCFGLHILRNYQALGDFLRGNALRVVLVAAREEWGFTDEETFFVRGVIATDVPTLFHTDHRWSERILLDHMRFVSNQSRDDSDIQTILEVPYLVPKGPSLDVVKVLRAEEAFSSLVLEKATSDYLPSICSLGRSCDVNRLYAYAADRNGLSFEEMDRALAMCPEIRGRNPVSAGGFYADSSTYFMGFLGKMFLCKDEETALEVAEGYSSLPLEYADNILSLPSSARDGGLLSSASGGLRVKADSSFDEGRAPSSTEEVVLSKDLYEEWGRPEVVYVTAEVASSESGGRRLREFSTASLKVVGTKRDSTDSIHVVSDWTSDFFYELGMSPFSLEPIGSVFYLDEDSDSESVISVLQKEFLGYRFSDPGKELRSSIANTTGYIGTVLGVFSGVSLLTSLFLFLIVMSITVNESKGEVRLLSAMGIGRKDIARGFRIQTYVYAFGSALGSLLGIAFCEVAVKSYLASSFGAKPTYSIDLWPLGLVLLTAWAFSSAVGLFLSRSIQRNDGSS